MNSDERKLLQLTLRIARAVMRAKLNELTYNHDPELQRQLAVFNRNRIARLRREYKKQGVLTESYASGHIGAVINCQARLLEDGEERNSTWLTV